MATSQQQSKPTIGWYDRQGNLVCGGSYDDPGWIANMTKVEELLKDPSYKIVKQEFTQRKQYWISTVWLGLNQNMLGLGKPVIFETMVFRGRKDSWYLIDGERMYYRKDYEQVQYSTERQARAGHKKLVEKYSDLEYSKQ